MNNNDYSSLGMQELIELVKSDDMDACAESEKRGLAAYEEGSGDAFGYLYSINEKKYNLHWRSLFALGKLFTNGATEADFKNAQHYLGLLLERGKSHVVYTAYGDLYYYSRFMQGRDVVKARQWYFFSIDKKDELGYETPDEAKKRKARVFAVLGTMALQDMPNVKANPNAALKLFELSYKLGNALSALSIGDLYSAGVFGNDYECLVKEAYWYLEAYKAGLKDEAAPHILDTKRRLDEAEKNKEDK